MLKYRRLVLFQNSISHNDVKLNSYCLPLTELQWSSLNSMLLSLGVFRVQEVSLLSHPTNMGVHAFPVLVTQHHGPNRKALWHSLHLKLFYFEDFNTSYIFKLDLNILLYLIFFSQHWFFESFQALAVFFIVSYAHLRKALCTLSDIFLYIYISGI